MKPCKGIFKKNNSRNNKRTNSFGLQLQFAVAFDKTTKSCPTNATNNQSKTLKKLKKEFIK